MLGLGRETRGWGYFRDAGNVSFLIRVTFAQECLDCKVGLDVYGMCIVKHGGASF